MQTDKSTNQMIPAHGLYEVWGNVPSPILVPNVRKRPSTIVIKMLIAVSTKTLVKTIAFDELVPLSNTIEHRVQKKNQWINGHIFGDLNKQPQKMKRKIHAIADKKYWSTIHLTDIMISLWNDEGIWNKVIRQLGTKQSHQKFQSK